VGLGQSVFGFTSTHAIASWLPLFLFLVLFGLSMDSHVFILSWIRESYDRTGDTKHAVAHSIKISAGVVTAAAVIMVFVFLTFATMSMVQLKEMGFRRGRASRIRHRLYWLSRCPNACGRCSGTCQAGARDLRHGQRPAFGPTGLPWREAILAWIRNHLQTQMAAPGAREGLGQ
jgi:MMPL family